MNNLESPLVSVIIPAYNAEKYIKKCIESIQNNTYQNLEILIINDGSKDNTRGVVESLLTDSRIILINVENGGVSRARNIGLDRATGEYVAFIDSDDYIREDYFEKLIKPCMEQGADSACCVYRRVDHNGTPLPDSRKRFSEDFLVTPQMIADHYFAYLDMGFINFVFRVYKRSVVGDTRFSETLKWGEDGSFNLELFRKSKKIYVSHEEMYFYVVHPNQATAKRMKGYTRMMIQHMGDIHRYIADFNGYRLQTVQQGMGRCCLGVLVECAAHAESEKLYRESFYDFLGQPWCRYLTDVGKQPAKWRLMHWFARKSCPFGIYLFTRAHRTFLQCKRKLKG